MGSNSVVVKMIMHFAFLMSIFPTDNFISTPIYEYHISNMLSDVLISLDVCTFYFLKEKDRNKLLAVKSMFIPHSCFNDELSIC